MKITIIPSDSIVGVDGLYRRVDVSDIDPAIHAVQFDTAKAAGEIEYRADALMTVTVAAPTEEDPYAVRVEQLRRQNTPITELGTLQVYVDRWTAAAPVPPPQPTAAELEAARIASIKAAAYRVITGRYAEWKQRNMSARALELVNKSIGGPLTTAEADELAALLSVWDWVKAVRQASDDAEVSGITAEEIVWPV